MWWLTWRQHRAQILVTVALIAGLGVLLMADSLPMDVVEGLPWAPVVIGLFWGVPLVVTEFERGTNRLVWTQSVLRRRWLVVKLAGLGVAVTLAGLALGALVTAFTETTPEERFAGSELFGVTGIVPGAWFLAVFAVGAAAGSVTRRILPAMAVTLAVAAALVAGAYAGRPYYAEPLVVMETSAGLALPVDALVTDQGMANAAGDLVTWGDAAHLCPTTEPVRCMEERGYDQPFVAYQPTDRYWRFQWTEVALLLLVAAACTAVTVRRVLRRPV